MAYLIPSLIMFAIALGVAVSGVLQYRMAARVSAEMRLATMLLIVGIGALLSVALTNRTLDEDLISTGVQAMTYDDMASGFSASRWMSLFLVGAALIEIVRGWVRSRHEAAPDPGRHVLIALLVYFMGTLCIEAFASDNPDFSFRDLYVPVLLTAVCYQRPASLAPIFTVAKWVIFALTLGSLAAIWLKPELVVHRPDPAWIPGLNWRLFGLAPHANALGPIALLGILIELHAPSRSVVLRWLRLLLATAVLVLAQSKTTWATIPLMLLMVTLPLALRAGLIANDPALRFRWTVGVLLVSIVVLVVASSAMVAFDAFDAIQRRSDLMTLTGRTKIWDITLEAWQKNPLFGYGPGIWGPERRLQFHMFHVGHAHNQVVQTLGESGIAGLLLMLAYLGTLLLVALRRFAASRGLVLMLLMLLLVRCVTEAPLRGEGLLSWATFLHMLLVMVACHHARQPPAGRARQAEWRHTAGLDTGRGPSGRTGFAWSGLEP